MKKYLLLGAIAAATAAPAFAQTDSEWTASGNVALTSDYYWRNVSQSDQNVAIQGGFDLTSKAGFYAGVWASSIDFGGSENIEVDLYAGYNFTVADIAMNVGVIDYTYPDNGSDIDFWEVYVKAAKTWDKLTLSGSLNYDPDNENLYADVGVGYSITPDFAISAGYGNYSFDAGTDYDGYNVGATYNYGGLKFGLSYYDNDISGSDDNVVFTISKAL